MRRAIRVAVAVTLLAVFTYSIGTDSPWAAVPAAAIGPVVINEVESNGGVPGDWVELLNTGSAQADVGGFTFLDNDNTHTPYVIPAGTMIGPGQYLVLEEAQFGFGLGAPDSARLFAADGTTIVDSYSWTDHAAPTYGRCPNGTGDFITTGSSTKAAANNCVTVRINEIESDGGTPADWIELTNYGPSSIDISGYVVKDNDNLHIYTLPASTMIAAGAYRVLEEASLGFALDAADSVRLFAPGGTTLVDNFSWVSHAATTYGRCAPNGTGVFITTPSATKGAANTCLAWPGGAAVQTVDPVATFTSNLSGLTYEGSGSAAPGVLWAVRNGPEKIYRLVLNGTTWTPDISNGWTDGKQLRYTDGFGQPDSEGLTFAATLGRDIYVATERNNSMLMTNCGTPICPANNISRLSVLRFDLDPTAAGTDPTALTARNDWNLTPALPPVGANLGLEAITWISDEFLTDRKFFDESKGHTYVPGEYAEHAGGLFFVGVEATGVIYAFALNHADGTSFTRIATIPTGFPGVMALEFDRELELLWAVCDNTCNGLSAVLDVNAQGRFAVAQVFERPAGFVMNLNNEGFAVAPQSECVDNRKPAFWADDGDTDGHSIRAGTVNCGPTTVQECKKDDWRTFGFPVEFKNTGDCVSYVTTGGKNAPTSP